MTTTTTHAFGTSTETRTDYLVMLAIQPRGFWSLDPVSARLERGNNNVWQADISWSTGGYNHDADIIQVTLDKASAMIWATQWVESKLKELNGDSK
jgi:hypothetical protein